jgi:hypothetical protein
MYNCPTLLDDKKVRLFIRTLKTSRYRKYDKLIKGLQIEDVTERLVLMLLSLCPTLDYLSLIGHGAAIQINSSFLERFLAVENITNLKAIEFGSEFDHITAKGFNSILKRKPSCFKSLKEIKLGTSDWINIETLDVLFSNCPNLSNLIITNPVTQIHNITNLIPLYTETIVLNFQNIILPASLLMDISNFQNLKKLSLSWINGISSSQLQNIHLPNLHALHMKSWKFNHFSSDHITKFAKLSFANLRHVSFVDLKSFHHEEDVGFLFIAELSKYSKQLTFLDISTTGIPLGREILHDVTSFKHLQTLIYGNLLGRDDIFDDINWSISLAADLVNICK